MKKKCFILILCVMLSVLSVGCQQRRMAPNPQQTQPGGSSPRISTISDRAPYCPGVVTSDIKAQTGMSGNSPITYSVPSGSTVKIIGKYDNYNVAVLPNNQIGLVPIGNTQPATPTPAKTIPTPAAGGGTTGAQPGSTAGSNMPQEATTMLNLVNQARTQASLNPLTLNSDLSRVAGLKATDMVNKNYFSHTSPTYGSPFDMMKTYGISYLYAGENLALNQNVQSAETALMNSPGHKANILSANFNQIGIGIAQKPDGSRIYVQMFIGR